MNITKYSQNEYQKDTSETQTRIGLDQNINRMPHLYQQQQQQQQKKAEYNQEDELDARNLRSNLEDDEDDGDDENSNDGAMANRDIDEYNEDYNEDDDDNDDNQEEEDVTSGGGSVEEEGEAETTTTAAEKSRRLKQSSSLELSNIQFGSLSISTSPVLPTAAEDEEPKRSLSSKRKHAGDANKDSSEPEDEAELELGKFIKFFYSTNQLVKIIYSIKK